MTQIKICGVRRSQDIDYINKYLPDYVGFVFSKSKRQIGLNEGARLCKDTDPRIKKVGVFVNVSVDDILMYVKKCNLDVVQLHGDESLEYIKALKLKIPKDKIIWKAFKIKSEPGLNPLENYADYLKLVDALLLDTYVAGKDGGSGKTFDWSYAIPIAKNCNVILAGGLSAENVLNAIELVKPMIVDVSSGIEVSEFKDEEKIKLFIEKVRGVNKNG